MAFTDPDLLNQMESSPCFGKAFEPTVKECKMCDLQQECAAKTKSNSVFNEMKKLNPETEQALKKAEANKPKVPFPTQPQEPEEKETAAAPVEKPAKPKKEKKQQEIPEGMPNTKGMSVEELKELLEARGGTCKHYESPAIYKMRLIMALKKTYQ